MSHSVYTIDTSQLSLDNGDDFTFEIISMDDIDELLTFYRESKFFDHELLSLALKVTDSPACIVEMELLISKTVEDGLSVAARDKQTGKIVSAAVCKLQKKPSPGNPGVLEVISASFKDPASLAVMDFIHKVDAKVDMYDKYNTDTLIELMFLATREEYRGRHLAKAVCRLCLQIASQTSAGIIITLATSPWTERIAEGLGFDLLHKANYSEFSTPDGVNYTDIFGQEKMYNLRALPLKTFGDSEVKGITLTKMTAGDFIGKHSK